MSTILSVRGLSKGYSIGGRFLPVIQDLDLDLEQGEILAIVGQSGSGKSTLLHQVGLLDRPEEGEIRFHGERLPLTGPQAAWARNRHFGFVFQFYHLLPEFTALENTIMPALMMEGWTDYRRRKKEIRQRGESLLQRVGLTERMDHRPPQLSGGERQRVAIARALINRPEVLLCDEPTGNLDRRTSAEVKTLLWDLNRDEGQTMIVVTHDPGLAADAHRMRVLVDGRLEVPAETQ